MSTSHVIPAGPARQPTTEFRFVEPSGNLGSTILLGDSPDARRLRSQIERIAPHFRIALIRGEIGVGKQLVARAIHARSSGIGSPFVVAHASAFADSLYRAAPTPYVASGPSLPAAAEGGTLYLQRLDELSFAQQEVLLRFLRDRWERRGTPQAAGSRIFDRRQERRSGSRHTGTRILAASNRDLGTLAAIGQFRQDLYAQLSAVEITVPTLNQRRDDIPALATSLLSHLARQTGQTSKRFTDAALTYLQDRLWPGNLRELERVVAHAAALCEGPLIELRHLRATLDPAACAADATRAKRMDRLQDVIDAHVLEVLSRCGGNKLRAAEMLGISRSTLYRMLGSIADPASMLAG